MVEKKFNTPYPGWQYIKVSFEKDCGQWFVVFYKNDVLFYDFHVDLFTGEFIQHLEHKMWWVPGMTDFITDNICKL